LDEDLARLRLGQFLLHNDAIEQLALRSKLEDKVNSIILVECVLEAKQTWMADAHQNCNLLLEPFDLGLFARACALLELLHSVPHTTAFLDT
jgi:hypothetical protein